MKKKVVVILTAIMLFIASTLALYIPILNNLDTYAGDKTSIICTTTIASDIAINIVGNTCEVDTLMTAGLDPHSYQASALDVIKLQDADIIVYCGLDLEGKMAELFSVFTAYNKDIIALSDGIDSDDLLLSEDSSTLYDPHFWFNPLLYIDTAIHFCERLSDILPNNSDYYNANLETYISNIMTAHNYCLERIEDVAIDSRVLITAHDAFSYFGKAYGFEVLGLAGISTASEVGTADVATLADIIATRQIKAIFTESSVSAKSILSLQEAVQARGFSVLVGGELYSDSLGNASSGADTYIGTLMYNIDTIVDALA